MRNMGCNVLGPAVPVTKNVAWGKNIRDFGKQFLAPNVPHLDLCLTWTHRLEYTALPKCPRLPFSQFDHCLQNPSDVAENAGHSKTAHVSVELIILPSYKRSGNSRLCRFLARHQASLSTKILFFAGTNLKECFPKGRQHSPGQTCILHSKKVHCFFPRYFYSCGKHSSCVRAVMQDSGCIRSCRILDLWVSAEIASNAEEDWWGHSFFQGS